MTHPHRNKHRRYTLPLITVIIATLIIACGGGGGGEGSNTNVDDTDQISPPSSIFGGWVNTGTSDQPFLSWSDVDESAGFNIDELVKSPPPVMPGLTRHPELIGMTGTRPSPG